MEQPPIALLNVELGECGPLSGMEVFTSFPLHEKQVIGMELSPLGDLSPGYFSICVWCSYVPKYPGYRKDAG